MTFVQRSTGTRHRDSPPADEAACKVITRNSRACLVSSQSDDDPSSSPPLPYRS
jgi:hypothetical protein